MLYPQILLHLRSLLLLCVPVALSLAAAISDKSPDYGLERRQTPAAAPLVDFEVYEPVLTPTGDADENGCVYTELLMDYVFAFSYGKPFVGTEYLEHTLEELEY